MKENREVEEKNEDDSDSAARKSTFNQLVSKSERSVAKTRPRPWLSQIRECWPLALLAAIMGAEIDTILQSYASTSATASDLPKPTLKSWVQGYNVSCPYSSSPSELAALFWE